MGRDLKETRTQGADKLRGPLRICGRCGQEQNYEDELVEQDGMWVHADTCFDLEQDAGNIRLIL